MLLFWRRFLQNSEAGDQNRPSSCWEKALRVSGIMPLEMETLGLEDLLCHRRRGDDQDGDVTQLQAHDRSLVRDLYCWDTSSRMFPTSGSGLGPGGSFTTRPRLPLFAMYKKAQILTKICASSGMVYPQTSTVPSAQQGSSSRAARRNWTVISFTVTCE